MRNKQLGTSDHRRLYHSTTAAQGHRVVAEVFIALAGDRKQYQV